MDWYVAYVAAYTKAYTKLFNVQIVEVADRSDDYINTFFIPLSVSECPLPREYTAEGFQCHTTRSLPP